MVYYTKRTIKLEKIELIKFLNGQVSVEEAKRVIDWLDQVDSKKVLDEIFEKDWNNVDNLEDPDAYHRILHEIHEKTIQRSKKDSGKRPFFFMKIAASFLFFLCTAYLIFIQVAPEESLVAETPAKIYQKKAGVGEKLRITLPDDTAVILNSLSELSFTSEFGKVDRVVSLTGEAFFEIQPDLARPFQVETGFLVSKALGTSFNVFSRNENTTIALTEGKVSVKRSFGDLKDEIFLFPGEMAYITNNDHQNIAVKKFDPEIVTAWKEGKIRFKRKSLENIMEDLRTWYGVSVEYQGDVNRKRTVTGVFDNESLRNILDGLSFSMGINYELKENQVIIKS